ncbi:hypothetical protein COCVIDRAFT_93946 [Bipolaris victoriae FI3]|uniref:Uncharacterized protein n=1 Tax=Bipolaris victoriae (strain FI3) TaxID=930091 RepID=W7EM15_BIPV3|nr:hypothetical protein COCVIDRAFT_93946 [Bipolaris victoriae FI3]
MQQKACVVYSTVCFDASSIFRRERRRGGETSDNKSDSYQIDPEQRNHLRQK